VPLLNTGLVFVGDQSIMQRKLLIVEDKRKDTVGAIVVMGCLGLRLPMELETLLGLSHVRCFLTRPINGCLCEVIFLDNLQHRCNPALSACVGCWMSMAARSICLRGLQARPWRINSPPKLLEFLAGLAGCVPDEWRYPAPVSANSRSTGCDVLDGTEWRLEAAVYLVGGHLSTRVLHAFQSRLSTRIGPAERVWQGWCGFMK
jgi:hypothetical protein